MQPTPYERKYDLTNDDGQDLRTQLDIELDDVARCFLETLTNLALIQRDDGQLANKSVGVEQLKAELIAGFNPPEPFQPFRIYEVSDSFVTDDGKWYIVNTAFTATADPADNTNDITLVYDFAAVRVDTIAAKDAAEAAQTAAELARDQAQAAETNAEAAQGAAETAQAGAETAETGSISARNTAENARDAAELARDAAQLAETGAEQAEAAARAAFDAFDDRYLGQKASPPTTDNDGNALLEGAMYWDTSAPGLYVWDGAAWQANDVVALTQDASNVNVNTSTGTQTLEDALDSRVAQIKLSSFSPSPTTQDIVDAFKQCNDLSVPLSIDVNSTIVAAEVLAGDLVDGRIPAPPLSTENGAVLTISGDIGISVTGYSGFSIRRFDVVTENNEQGGAGNVSNFDRVIRFVSCDDFSLTGKITCTLSAQDGTVRGPGLFYLFDCNNITTNFIDSEGSALPITFENCTAIRTNKHSARNFQTALYLIECNKQVHKHHRNVNTPEQAQNWVGKSAAVGSNGMDGILTTGGTGFYALDVVSEYAVERNIYSHCSDATYESCRSVNCDNLKAVGKTGIPIAGVRVINCDTTYTSDYIPTGAGNGFVVTTYYSDDISIQGCSLSDKTGLGYARAILQISPYERTVKNVNMVGCRASGARYLAYVIASNLTQAEADAESFDFITVDGLAISNCYLETIASGALEHPIIEYRLSGATDALNHPISKNVKVINNHVKQLSGDGVCEWFYPLSRIDGIESSGNTNSYMFSALTDPQTLFTNAVIHEDNVKAIAPIQSTISAWSGLFSANPGRIRVSIKGVDDTLHDINLYSTVSGEISQESSFSGNGFSSPGGSNNAIVEIYWEGNYCKASVKGDTVANLVGTPPFTISGTPVTLRGDLAPGIRYQAKVTQ